MLINLDTSEVRGAEVDWETEMSPFSFRVKPPQIGRVFNEKRILAVLNLKIKESPQMWHQNWIR